MTNPKRNDGRNKDYSISQKLRKTGKSSEEFEIIFNALSLEEVIGLKLELASSSAFNKKLYGVPIWSSIPNIVKDAVLKYALSATRSKREAARFLGLNEFAMKKNINRYKIDEYFEAEKIKKEERSSSSKIEFLEL
jgi:hypothetical protein